MAIRQAKRQKCLPTGEQKRVLTVSEKVRSVHDSRSKPNDRMTGLCARSRDAKIVALAATQGLRSFRLIPSVLVQHMLGVRSF